MGEGEMPLETGRRSTGRPRMDEEREEGAHTGTGMNSRVRRNGGKLRRDKSTKDARTIKR